MLMHERFKQQSVLHNMPFVTLMFALGEIRHYNIISICSIDMMTPRLNILFDTIFLILRLFLQNIYFLFVITLDYVQKVFMMKTGKRYWASSQDLANVFLYVCFDFSNNFKCCQLYSMFYPFLGTCY